MPAGKDEIISLIAVTDGREDSLRALCQTAASVFEQTYLNLELLIVRWNAETASDCRAGTAAELVAEPAAVRHTDRKPEPFANERLLRRITANRRVPVRVLENAYASEAEAKNAGIAAAAGQWLLFLNCGDWMDSLMAEQLYFRAKWGGAGLALCGLEQEFEEGRTAYLRPETELLTDKCTFLNTLFAGYYRDGLLGAASNQLFRTSLVRETGVSFQPMASAALEHTVFFMRYLQHCDTICILPTVLLTAFPEFIRRNPATPQQEMEDAFLLLNAYDTLFDSAAPDDEVVNDMNNEMLGYLLRCGEQVCYAERSGRLSREESQQALERFAGREAFQKLLSQTSPEGVWNCLASLLLRTKRYRLYRQLLRLRLSLDTAAGRVQQEVEAEADRLYETAAERLERGTAETEAATAAADVEVEEIEENEQKTPEASADANAETEPKEKEAKCQSSENQ